MRRCWTCLLITASCARLPDIEWEHREDLDEGFLCLSTDEEPSVETLGVEPQVFEPGRPIAVHYDAARCFSGSCADNLDVQIEATVEGSTLTLSTTLGWDAVRPAERVVCTADCQVFDAVVPEITTLDEGSWTLAWAGQTVDFDVPGESLACIGTRAYEPKTPFE